MNIPTIPRHIKIPSPATIAMHQRRKRIERRERIKDKLRGGMYALFPVCAVALSGYGLAFAITLAFWLLLALALALAFYLLFL